MRLGVFFVPVALCVIFGSLRAQEPQEPRDMKECIQAIRDQRMSEGAQNQLNTVAGIRVGSEEVFFEKTPSGLYGTGLRSLACANPSADPAAVEAMRGEWKRKMTPELVNLRWLADADTSGFVSTAEGFNLRRLVEFGYKAAYILSAESHDLKALCTGLGMREEDLRATLKEYATLQEKAKRANIQPFPEVALQ
jgi:hypothetical protein